MINELLEFIKKRLDLYLTNGSSTEQPISFMQEEPTDAVKFPAQKIVPVLIQVEEDKAFLPADRHLHVNKNGLKFTSNPSIAINLILVFVSNYTNYLEGTRRLSQIIHYFQANAFFNKEKHPDLPASIPDVKIELHPLTLGAQNEMWSMLRAPYRPSAAYKVKLLLVETPEPTELPETIREVEATLTQIK